jgi:hypothetical protein
MTIAYGCCVGWWQEFNNYVVPWVGDQRVYGDGELPKRPIMALAGQTSIATAYNAILGAAEFLWPHIDALVLLHSDLEILDPNAEEKILEAMTDDVGIVGVCGGGGANATAWWTDSPIGHQVTDSLGLLDFPIGTGVHRTGDVEVLEGSLLAFSPRAIRQLRFDVEYPGFHGYDEICFYARAQGFRCVVADIDTHHHSQVGWKDAQSEADWAAANKRCREKWMS